MTTSSTTATTAGGGSPWIVAVEGVTRSRLAIRARYRDRTTSTSRERHRGESIEWQAGQTLGIYSATVALALDLNLRIVPPGAYDDLHRAERGGSGQLEDYYPPVLTGKADRPETWLNDIKDATGRRRGQHERAAWAIAMRAACQTTGRPWNPAALLHLHDLPPVIGVDPGAEWTGIVACVGPRVLEAATIGRAAAPEGVAGFDADVWLLDRLRATLAGMLTRYHAEAERALAQARQAEAVGVEG